MSKITLRFDASAMVKSACDYRLKLIVADGYTDKLPWNDTQYGSAFHKFVAEMYITSGNVAAATKAALAILNRPCKIREGKQHLNQHHLLKTCFDYWEHFRKTDNFEVFMIDGKPLVEIDFDITIHETENFIIKFTGTSDKVGRFINGCYALGDYKTHSLWSMMNNKDGRVNAKEREFNIKKYFKSHEMATQLRFYLMNLRIKARENPDSEFGKICSSKSFGAFIDGVFLSSSEDTLFRRSDVWMWTQNDMDEYEVLMRRRVLRFVQLLQENPDYAMRDGLTCGACVDGKFPCQFINVCSNSEPKVRQLILNNDYTKRNYNPLEFSK